MSTRKINHKWLNIERKKNEIENLKNFEFMFGITVNMSELCDIKHTPKNKTREEKKERNTKKN
jgi:hypothetical protein